MSENLPAQAQGKIVVFGTKKIRRLWHEEQWFFSVVDIIAALTDSDNPRNYWNMMKAREQKQSKVQLSTPFQAPKRSLLSSGLPKSAMNAFRR